MMFGLSGIVLVAAILLGGGTRAGFLGDVVVQLLAIPLLLMSAWVWSSARLPSRRSLLLPLFLGAGLVAVLVLQLIPVPGAFWSKFGAGSLAAFGLESAGHLDVWRPLSLTPHATWAAAVSVLVAFAIFGAVAQLDASSRLKLCWLILGLGAIALVLGLLQVAQGTESGLRLFEITNPTEAVGFFANRNHFAAQLYVTLLFAAVWFTPMAQASLQPGVLGTRTVLGFAASAVFLVAIAAGLATARSRAGIVLAMAAIFGIVIMAFRSHRETNQGGRISRKPNVGRIVAATLSFAVLFATQFGLHRIQSRFEADPLEDLRIPFTTTTLETAVGSLPIGTGLGSFVPVYASVEKASDVFVGYANRAHNDIAEFLLEAGIAGGLLILLFVAWFVIRSYAIWFKEKPSEPNNHLLLQRAATIAIALLLAHSLVDYPLRTTAMAALFAFSCAILVPPLKLDSRHEAVKRNSAAGSPKVEDNQVKQPVLRERWGSDVEWPEAWRKKPNNQQDREES